MQETYDRVLKLQDQIRTYNEKLQEERQKYNMLVMSIQQLEQNYHQYYPLYTFISEQEKRINYWKDQVEVIKMDLLNKRDMQYQKFLSLEYKDFISHYGNINETNLMEKLNEAASLLVSLDEEAAKLQSQREEIMMDCRKIQNETAAIKQDMDPIREQTKNDEIQTRQSNHLIQNKINYLSLDRINKRNNFIAKQFQEKTEIKMIESQIEIEKTKYIYQEHALKGLNLIHSLLNMQNISNEDKESKKSQILSFIEILDNEFPIGDDFEKQLKNTKNETKHLLKLRKGQISNINTLVGGLEKMVAIEDKTISLIDNNITQNDINSFDQLKTANLIKRTRQQNTSLKEEIEQEKEDISERQKYLSSIKEDIESANKNKDITTSKLNKKKEQLNNLRQKRQTMQNQYKEKEKEWNSFSGSFLLTLKTISDKYQSELFKKSYDELNQDIEAVKKNIKLDEAIKKRRIPSKTEQEIFSKEQHTKLQNAITQNIKINNIQLIYSIMPHALSIEQNDNLQFYIISFAKPNYACDALFYPYNIDPLYPSSLLMAVLINHYNKKTYMNDTMLSLINLVSHTLSNDTKNDGQPRNPFTFSSVKPDCDDTPVQPENIVNGALSFIDCIAHLQPFIGEVKKLVNSLLTDINNKSINEKAQNLSLFLNPPSHKRANTERSRGLSFARGHMDKEKDKTEVENKTIRGKPNYRELNTSLKAKDYEQIALLTNIFSDNDFYKHFEYIQFNVYRQLTAYDLIKYCQDPCEVTDTMKKFDHVLMKLKGYIIDQIMSAEGGGLETIIMRFIKVAKIAYHNNNYYFLAAICEAFANDGRIIEKIETELSSKPKLAAARKIFNDLKKINENDKDARERCKDKKVAQFIPDKLLFNRLKSLLTDPTFSIKNDLLPMSHYRKIAEEISFLLQGQDSYIEFRLIKTLVEHINKSEK
ncbi:hypothetical protein TRFO_12501 [Tritrichomonas foetus]|uniref:Uncharacterized protein n=1 Tax=Tritrichomonas foetus TaxID=1144522 RepID=A0A1J4L5W0_9EUKA|nr:hypothetical protein TRFO_12501 [Tritrichomonas foetus]|eukprot:OHT17333.1 hypothetical protein TRFO_12501 [Tritrichomonas foetus]